MTTYDEDGGYPHPDHIMCHRVSTEAFDAAGDPDRYVGHGAEPWAPLKLYYNQTFSRAKITAYHEALLAAGAESPFSEWMERWEERAERAVTTRVPVGDHLETADARAAGPRHAGRPGRDVVLGPGRHPSRGLADGGVRAGPQPGRRAGRRSRRQPGARGGLEDDLFAGVRERLAAGVA